MAIRAAQRGILLPLGRPRIVQREQRPILNTSYSRLNGRLHDCPNRRFRVVCPNFAAAELAEMPRMTTWCRFNHEVWMRLLPVLTLSLALAPPCSWDKDLVARVLRLVLCRRARSQAPSRVMCIS